MKVIWTALLFIVGAVLVFLSGISFFGCATQQHRVITATTTVIGIEIAQNPANQMYAAKLGYVRGELAVIPTNRQNGTNDVATGHGAKDSVDVIMELKYANPLSFGESGVYQRLAVGSTAVKQPGAIFMFAKDKTGHLDPVTAATISRSIQSLPVDTTVTAMKTPLAEAYEKAADKAKFDVVAKGLGYASFAAFLIEATTTSDIVSKMVAELTAAKLFP